MEWLLVYGLVFARLASFFAMIPLIGDGDLMPSFAKGVLLIVLLPFMVAPMVAPVPLQADLAYIFLLGKEALLGLFIGFLVSLPLRLPEMIGDLIDAQRGAAVTDAYNPLSGQQSSPLGQLFMFTNFAYFLNESGVDSLVAVISGSFALQSITSYEFGFGSEFSSVYLTVLDHYMRLFAILSLPVIAAMMMSELALGLASRSAQSLNAFQLSQPVKAVIAMSVCVMLQPHFIRGLSSWMSQLASQFGG
jgi:type III secretion protein T